MWLIYNGEQMSVNCEIYLVGSDAKPSLIRIQFCTKGKMIQLIEVTTNNWYLKSTFSVLMIDSKFLILHGNFIPIFPHTESHH